MSEKTVRADKILIPKVVKESAARPAKIPVVIFPPAVGKTGFMKADDHAHFEHKQQYDDLYSAKSGKAGAGKGKGKKVGPKKKTGGGGGLNAIGPDGKPNKGIVLKKSVEYIRCVSRVAQP